MADERTNQEFDRTRNYYEVLGISPDATPREIRDAYIRLAKQVHPDHNNQNDRLMIELNAIYEVLSNEAKRRTYDERFVQEKVHDFTESRKPETSEKPKEQLAPSLKQIDLLKTLRLVLTGLLVCLFAYLVFYLAVNILDLVTTLPEWLLKLAPKTF